MIKMQEPMNLNLNQNRNLILLLTPILKWSDSVHVGLASNWEILDHHFGLDSCSRGSYCAWFHYNQWRVVVDFEGISGLHQG